MRVMNKGKPDKVKLKLSMLQERYYGSSSKKNTQKKNYKNCGSTEVEEKSNRRPTKQNLVYWDKA